MTISKDSKPRNGAQGTANGGSTPAGQQAPQPTKTDQEILEELRQAGGGNQRRRSVGLTAFVILLAIVITVFTAVNGRKDEKLAEQTNNEAASETTDEDGTTNDTADTQDDTSDSDDSTDVAEETSDESDETPVEVPESTTATGEAVGELPNAQSTQDQESYSEAAQVGEGVTHLARRALYSYLADRNITDLSAAHKIFAEDYVAKHSSPVYLEIGEGRTFSTSLLDEAITNARTLTQPELANLNQLYAPLVPGL